MAKTVTNLNLSNVKGNATASSYRKDDGKLYMALEVCISEAFEDKTKEGEARLTHAKIDGWPVDVFVPELVAKGLTTSVAFRISSRVAKAKATKAKAPVTMASVL